MFRLPRTGWESGMCHLATLATIISGVLAIGILNFLVSFSLAFIVALKSGGVRLKDYPEFIGILGRYFKKNRWISYGRADSFPKQIDFLSLTLRMPNPQYDTYN